MSNVVLVVELDIDPDRLDDFIDIVTRHGANSLKVEEGCLRFEILRPRELPNKVILIEMYADDAALESHWNSEHMAAYREKVGGMILARVARKCDIA